MCILRKTCGVVVNIPKNVSKELYKRAIVKKKRDKARREKSITSDSFQIQFASSTDFAPFSVIFGYVPQVLFQELVCLLLL